MADRPPDLLLITHNRLCYAEKSIEHLLKDPSEFQVYWWDNASTDGTADLMDSVDDPRIVVKHHCPENLNQHKPCLWFFEKAQSDIVGKIDDDILLPQGWTVRLASMLRADDRFGVLGCWIFMTSDWCDNLVQRWAKTFSGYRVLRNVAVQGQSCLSRKDVLVRYIDFNQFGYPINQMKMSEDGYVNGFPVPPLFGENMDDPRSEHYRNLGQIDLKTPGLTAERLGFKTTTEYAEWIAADAYMRQLLPFSVYLKMVQLDQAKGLHGKVMRLFIKPLLRELSKARFRNLW